MMKNGRNLNALFPLSLSLFYLGPFTAESASMHQRESGAIKYVERSLLFFFTVRAGWKRERKGAEGSTSFSWLYICREREREAGKEGMALLLLLLPPWRKNGKLCERTNEHEGSKDCRKKKVRSRRLRRRE
jgi:hypothetical protein